MTTDRSSMLPHFEVALTSGTTNLFQKCSSYWWASYTVFEATLVGIAPQSTFVLRFFCIGRPSVLARRS